MNATELGTVVTSVYKRYIIRVCNAIKFHWSNNMKLYKFHVIFGHAQTNLLTIIVDIGNVIHVLKALASQNFG